jgi:integrase/recombinase XerD
MTSTTSDSPATTLRERFVEDMNLHRLSRATQHNYLRDMTRFANWLGRPPDLATGEDLRRYQIEQRETGLGAPAMNMAVSALRFFYTRTLDRQDLTRKLHRVKHPRALPTVLSREEVTRMLDATTSIKHQAILSVAYGAGLRASEVTKLKVRDIDSERMLLRVECGKGGRHRNAMLAQDLLVLLREWWKVGRQQGVMHADGWLFPGQHYLKPVCYRQVHRIAAEAARMAGITKRVGPHTLRHSFATHLLEDGVDVRIIQTLLGHAKLETTALYTRVATRTVKNVISPLDRLSMFPAVETAPDG